MDTVRQQALRTAIALAAPRYPRPDMETPPEVFAAIGRAAAGVGSDDEGFLLAALSMVQESERLWGETNV